MLPLFVTHALPEPSMATSPGDFSPPPVYPPEPDRKPPALDNSVTLLPPALPTHALP